MTNKYFNTYAGKKLLENYSLKDRGIWVVWGEDPNCDLGGHHYTPRIGYYEGKLEDIVEYATKHPDFYTWGGGGRIELIHIETINTEKLRVLPLIKQVEELEAQIRALKDEINGV